MANSNAVFQRLLEYRRLVTQAVLTEEGLYAKDEVPTDYAGAFQAEISVCYAILQTDAAGGLRLVTYNPPDMMNRSRRTGLPLRLKNAHLLRSGEAGVLPEIVLDWQVNTHLPEELRGVAAGSWDAYAAQIGEWVL